MAPPFTQPHVEQSAKRIRVLFNGTYIVDSNAAKLVWEHQFYPHYYFPTADIPSKYLQVSKDVSGNTSQATFDIVVGDKIAEKAAIQFGESDGKLDGLIKVVFGAVDAWFEEDEQIFVHPKDPYKRVDVLQSSRHVRVEVDGVEVANTHHPRLLFETLLPVRTYIPKTDCRMDLLEPSDLTTECPYKGVASYYSVRVPNSSRPVKDIVWWYRTTTNDCLDIKGFVAFYDEKVDVWVDGEKVERPLTHWS